MSQSEQDGQQGSGFEQDMSQSVFKFWGALAEIRERAAAEGLPIWIDREVTSVLHDWETWVARQLDEQLDE